MSKYTNNHKEDAKFFIRWTEDTYGANYNRYVHLKKCKELLPDMPLKFAMIDQLNNKLIGIKS